MTSFFKALGILVVGAVIGAVAVSSMGGSLGGVYNQVQKYFPAGIQIGNTGNTVSKVIQGTCNPTFSSTSLAATSTGQFFCTVTGAASGDKVFVSLPAAARTGAAQWFEIADTYATTTNRIGFDIANFSGVATTSFAQATTGVQYLIVR